MQRRTDRNPRLELLRAAEALFVAQGVDAVSLREIARAAGHGNHSSAVYHFGDKRTLVNALLERHSDPIQVAWMAVVAHLEAEGRDSLEELVGLMVRTLVAKLDDPDGGAAYLNVVAQLVNNPNVPLTDLPATTAPGILALSAGLMRNMAPIPPELFPLRMTAVTALLYSSIAAFQRFTSLGLEIPREAFISDLVSAITAMLRAS